MNTLPLKLGPRGVVSGVTFDLLTDITACAKKTPKGCHFLRKNYVIPLGLNDA
jgi:hypothetical protein